MATAANEQQEELSPRAKSAIRGAWFGFFVDMFDILSTDSGVGTGHNVLRRP